MITWNEYALRPGTSFSTIEMPTQKKRKNSKKKGSSGERELAHFLSSMGLKSRRTQQYCGATGDASDVLCEALPTFHIESKRTERFHLYDAVDQARVDAHGKVPVVFHRMNHRPWVIVMEADVFINLLKQHGVTLSEAPPIGPSDLDGGRNSAALSGLGGGIGRSPVIDEEFGREDGRVATEFKNQGGKGFS